MTPFLRFTQQTILSWFFCNYKIGVASLLFVLFTIAVLQPFAHLKRHYCKAMAAKILKILEFCTIWKAFHKYIYISLRPPLKDLQRGRDPPVEKRWNKECSKLKLSATSYSYPWRRSVNCFPRTNLATMARCHLHDVSFSIKAIVI